VLTRALAEADWPQVTVLEAATYGDLGLSEGQIALRSRAGVGTSFVYEHDGIIVGYVLALPWPYGKFPDLDLVGPSSVSSPNLHLHDMAVAAEHRRAGLGSRLTGHLLAVAGDLGYRRVSLVALDGREVFWARHGFHPQPAVPPPVGYGPGATYMSRSLD
jgi:predicted N-acetyltransferase YhbS